MAKGGDDDLQRVAREDTAFIGRTIAELVVEELSGLGIAERAKDRLKQHLQRELQTQFDDLAKKHDLLYRQIAENVEWLEHSRSLLEAKDQKIKQLEAEIADLKSKH